MKFFVFLISIVCLTNFLNAQTYVFAQLTGSPTMNTTGWNLTGNAYVGETNGDSDGNSDELILTNASNGQSGGVFYNQSIDLSTCYQWKVEFDFRMWEGNGADGIAFCFLDVPPSGFVSGGGVGIPSSSNGVFVILDTYDNGCGTNPEIQIYQGTNYSECGSGIINRATNMSFLRSSSYQTCRIEYVNGVINVYVNNTLRLSGNYSSTFIGYMGFTASTGGSNDKHSIKNVRIFADIATANAGPDITLCSGESGQIGSTNNTNYLYNWTNSQGLNATTVSAPTVNIVNSGTTTITQTYTLQANLAINPNSCPSYDQVNVVVLPVPSRVTFDTLCNGQTLNFYGQTLTSAGSYTTSLDMSPGGCDSLITINLTTLPVYQTNLNASICNGENYSFANQLLTTTGNYQQVLTSVVGCDSVINLNLVVNPVFATTLNASICEGETYTFFNQSISNSGSYQQLLQTVDGCDSIINLQLQVNPNFTTQENTSICAGETYNFFGQTLSSAGTYQHVLTSIRGCDSLIVLTLNLIANTTSTNQQNICSGESYSFYGQTLTSAGNYQHLLTNVAGCDSLVNLTLAVLPHSFSTVQQNICDGDVYSFFGQNLTSNGSYTKLLVSANGCDSTITLNLTVLPVPAPPIISSNSPLICPGDELKLVAQAVTNGQFLWSGPNNFTSSLTEITFNAYPQHIGTYEAVVTVNGCTSEPSSLEVKIENIFNFNDFEFPNIITPNGDGINDELDIESHYHTCLPYTLQLFNRWGNLIFEQSYGGERFNGKLSNGEIANAGVYFYRLVFKDGEKNGFIHIVY
jgi:gliding motility-associated-like protein